MLRSASSAVMLVLAFPAAVSAMTLYAPPSEMIFETATRQSAWGPGDAARIEDSVFLGAAWSGSQDFGEIAGGDYSIEIPNPKRVIYDACRRIPRFLRPNCGRRPPATLQVSVDTRTGAEASLSTAGRVGLDLGYGLDAGSLGAKLGYRAEASLPAGPPKRGEPFRLPTVATLSSGEFDSQSPKAEAKVDAVADLALAGSVLGCVISQGCKGGSDTFVDVSATRELLSIDPNRITYLDGFTPEFLTFETPLLARSRFEVEADPVTKRITGFFTDKNTGETSTKGDDPTGGDLSIELAAVDFRIPDLDLETTLGPGKGDLRLTGASDFLGIDADLDGLFAYAGVLAPPLGLTLELSKILSASVDLIDADAGPRIDLHQDYSLTPRLMVDLGFDREVRLRDDAEADWVAASSWSGPWEGLPEFILTEDTTFDPTFRLEALVDGSMWLQLGAAFDLSVLQGSLSLSLGSIGDTEFSLDAVVGPVFEEEFDLAEFARVSLFRGSFLLGGLSEFEGEPFRIALGGARAVPLPAAAPSLAAALGVLAAAAARRRQAKTGLARIGAATRTRA